MEVESETSFNDENDIAYERYSDEEPELYQINRKKLYPQCIIASDSNFEGDKSVAIKQEPRSIDLTESYVNGQFLNFKDGPSEASGNNATIENTSNICMLSNTTNLTKREFLSRDNKMNSPEICPEMGAVVSDMFQNVLQSRHPGVSPLQCSECDLECPSISALEFHSKLHIIERIAQSSYEYPGIGLRIPSDKVNRERDIDTVNVSQEASEETSYSNSGYSGERPHKCDACGFRFTSTTHLKRHLRTHTGDKPYSCTECDYSSGRKDKLKDHMKTHVSGQKTYSSTDFVSEVANISSNGANSPGTEREIYNESDISTTESFKCFSCTHCEYTCSKKAQLTRHMLRHTGTKLHGCPLCDYKCKEKGNLAKHLVIHGDDKPFSCPEEGCDYKCKLKCNLKTHMLKHSGEKPYACNLCDYRSIVKSGLTTHMFKHSGEKPFPCSVCGNRYALKGDLNAHMRIHTNNKKFKCQQCDYRCFTQQHLDQHMLTHTGEKPHKCDECGFRFTSTSHLKRHMRTHTGDKPYVCTECDYRSARNDKLKIHMQAHIGGQKPYACTECDYSTVRNDKLKDHMQTHNTGQKLYPCTECDYSASRNDYLKSHMKTHITGKLEQLKQSKPSNDLTINETINSLTKSNFISQKPNEGSSSTGATTGDNPVGSHGIFGSLSVRSSQLPNDLPHHSEVSNDSSQAHQTFHQGNAQSLNNQHIIGANSIMGRSIQETTHQDVNYKMYSNNMEYHSLSKRYSNFPPSAKPLWHQGSSSIPAVNTDGYNYQVLSDKLLYTRKVNTHAGENLAHISQNYSHNPLAPYPRPMFIDSSMPGPPNMSEMIRHATDLYNNQ